MLIRNWHAKASEQDYFSRFVFEYLAFISFLKTKAYPDSHMDRLAIQELKRNSSIEEGYLQIIDSDQTLKRAWEKVKMELDKTPLVNMSRNSEPEEIAWWNCSHDDISQKTEVDKNKPSGVLHSFEDWENMVEFWYSIRNNLFHGYKNPSCDRDQFLVEYGYKTLQPLMEILIRLYIQ